MTHRLVQPKEPEDETELVRTIVRRLAVQMQRQGEIPADVSQAELYREAEQYVSKITETLHKNPMYPHWKDTNHLQDHIGQLVQQTLAAPARSGPAVAKDQISYVHAGTGQALSPTWKHQNCGGTVYTSEADTFRCDSCKKSGSLGVELPSEMTPAEYMIYVLTQVQEVDLN